MGAAIVYGDNTSTIALVENGKSICDKTRHIAIKYFFISDRIIKKEVNTNHMSTGDMIVDVFTKPLQGTLFKKLRD